MTTASEVLAFWENAGEEMWYAKDDQFDQSIRDKFGATWQMANDGGLTDWMSDKDSALARIILLDQFPRNMFRNDPRAFATDQMALDTSAHMIAKAWDVHVEEPMRQFVYMPYMHSERPEDQARCCVLMAERMSGDTNLIHAEVHEEIIRRYGRFPYRNEALGRESTDAEVRFLENGGYADILQALQAERGN